MSDRTGSVIRSALDVAPALRKGLGLTLILAVLGQAITVVTPILIQRVIDDEVLSSGGVDMAGVLQLAVGAVAALILGVVIGRFALLRLVRSSATGLSDLRTMTFGHILRRSVLHVESERRGDLVSRVTSDVTTMQEFMEWGGVGLVVSSGQVILALIVMFFYEWRLAAMSLLAVTLYLFLMRYLQAALRRRHDEVRVEVGHSLGVLSEAISALPVVRSYGIEGPTTEKVRDALARRFDKEYFTARFGNTLFSTAEVFAGLLTAAIVIVGVLIGPGLGLTAGSLVAFLFLAYLLMEPMQLVVETLEFSQSAAAGLRRVLGVLGSEVEVVNPEKPATLRQGGLSARFAKVDYAYPSGPPVLRDVEVDIPVGSKIAVVGETGSGKTTFAKLLVRLLDPSSGSVFIGELPASSIGLDELRDRIAFVPQEGFLFDDTVCSNVRYGRPEASDAEVWTAFHELGLEDWISDLPAGLDTTVGERGENLSAGERQLVALVRAWIGSPDLLVLDEATSAVDPVLDVALRRAMERLIEGRTSVTIAHRLATAEGSDEVLVFDDGRLVERGNHRTLLAQRGVYADLYADWATGTKSV